MDGSCLGMGSRDGRKLCGSTWDLGGGRRLGIWGMSMGSADLEGKV